MADAIDPKTAWQPYTPSAQSPWDQKKVGHLYRRGGFGATWGEMQTGLAAGPEKTIDALFQGGPGQEEFDKQTLEWGQQIAPGNNGQQLRAWWLYRMLYSPHPLKEKMTLFWHNHFATSNAKVNNGSYMLGQHELMRKHALGNFRSLLLEMARDPAMMVWLDIRTSKKGMPNENYARELMELFSLGIGNYTETDIREAARAFTGWDIQENKAVFTEGQHDATDKTVLGKKGAWKPDDITRICLEQKCCPRFVAGKLYRFLISETVPATPELLDPLAEQLRQSDFDIGGLVKTMLRSNLFFSPTVYRTSVKSPVDFGIGIVRALEGHVADPKRKGGFGTTALATELVNLGQSLFYPPSVKGWDGGQTWLNGQTLLFRQNLALTLCSTEFRWENSQYRRPIAALLAQKHGKKSDAELMEFLVQLFLQGDVPAESRDRLTQYLEKSRKAGVPAFWTDEDAVDQRARALCHLVLTLPEYQLS